MATTKKQHMKVKLFSVTASDDEHPLEDVLQMIEATPLDGRNRELVNGQTIRVEELLKPADRKPYWLIDFVRLRFEHGPGRASEDRPVEGFELDDGDAFAEETAMLYDPRYRMLFVQANYFGVKDGAASAYFSMIDPDEAYGFELLPALDPTVAAKLARADRFTKFTMKVAPSGINAELRRQHVALGRALAVADEFHAPVLEVTMGVGHTKTALPTKLVRDAVAFIQRAVAQEPEAVVSAGVNGLDSADPEARSEFLDLIAPKRVWEFDDLELGPGLRYTLNSRFRALERARADWRQHH